MIPGPEAPPAYPAEWHEDAFHPILPGVMMLLLKKAHLGEVSVTVWPKVLKEICREKKIFVLE